ncbi:hypothetical protein E3N88_12219 [Mikania micrantha]|uniref:non-specific serine/threonine protein kinase n=1 Tax=Mikania micrantha TaxID=192012 RepID=A0A5N6P4V9_9ASTR|nr:hypothetical protein E3N88_12219 [Mikania micrantha]
MSCSSSSASVEDEDFDSYRKGGCHAVRVGDSFATGRFIAQRKLGWGQFSTVWLAHDRQTSKYVALKIQKSAPEFVQTVIHEIKILSTITENDHKTEKCVVQLRARRAVAKIAAERRGVVGGVAPETKPERCLDGIDFRCKIVDLGNACCADKPIAEEVQASQYHAPEVILQSGYSFPVDMWSFACTAFELATGEMMFAPKPGPGFSEDEVLQVTELGKTSGSDLLDHLALMMELLGKMPRKTETNAQEFAEFLNPILDFDPEKRPKTQQCLKHPWLSQTVAKMAA